ncbi:MAG: beta strand repeat-containing protein, partial [Bacteroidota bacterium]
TNNTASNLTSASSNVSTTFGSVTGIAISLGSLGTVANNTVSAIRATNTSAATNATGILLTGGQSVVINANRVTDITNASTATTSNPAATATGIQIGGGTTNATVSNNQVSLGSGQTTNTQFAGLWVTINNSGLLLNAFNNSIVITGAAASGNNNTYGMIRGNNTGTEISTIVNLRNNIFANNRTGGAGAHYAIANQTTSPTNNFWTNISSQYNLMVTANPNAMAEWGVSANSYNAWLTNSTSDNWSYYMQAGTGVGQLNLTNLFTNIANGNLTVPSANAESWYVFGKGIAGTAVNNLNTDYAGVSRGTTLGNGITIGSTQLNSAPTVLPPAAIASAAPSVNGTSIYRFASRPVLTLNWGASVPASATLFNYAGVNPPNALGGNNLNQYARVAVTGGTAPYNYTATVHYDPALIGGITSQGNMRVANENTGSTSTSPVWQLQTVSTVNLANSTVSSGAIASSLSDFYFSANENTAPPTISAFTPAAREVGGNVSIRGSLFTGASAVSFNGVNQPSYTVVNDTLITTTVPVGATTGPVSVTNIHGTGTSVINFTVIPAPTVTSISTSTGTFGTALTITGTGFTWATQVQFNTTNATFTVVNNTTITTTVPVGASTGVITVTNPAGSASSASIFNVIGAPTITSFTPASGAVGTTVTITGTNFQAITAVTFNNVAASYTVVSATSITAIVPSAATTGAVRVTNGSGTAISATNYTVLPVPTVDAFSPSSGGIGTVVTITGSNFANIDSVEFGGGVNATFTIVSPTQITATVGNGSISGVITVYRNGVAPVSSTGSFTVIPNLIVSTAQLVNGTYNNVTITSTGVATLNGTLNALGNVTVESGGVLNLGTEVVTGNGNFTAQSGSTLRVGSSQGISST